uniref:Kinesin motor domain-containing protein n=1 Tax=Onchocerca flexuosa TaxID=387005 RepID=A0A183HT88_9BILA
LIYKLIIIKVYSPKFEIRLQVSDTTRFEETVRTEEKNRIIILSLSERISDTCEFRIDKVELAISPSRGSHRYAQFITSALVN